MLLANVLAQRKVRKCELVSSFCSFFLLFPGMLSVTFDIQLDLKMKHPKLKFGSQFRSIFRTLLKIEDEGFCENS